MAMTQPTIFITIPAYEDPELIPTIERALENALYPDRLFFCIGLQYKQTPDISKYINNPNFKFLFYDVDNRPGVYYIRREMANQYANQDYFLMLDSHMVFSKYWDARLICDYKHLSVLHGDRVILSKPCVNEAGCGMGNGRINDVPHWKVVLDNPENIQRTIIPWVTQYDWDGEPFTKSYYVCSHFMFVSGKFLDSPKFHEGVRAYSEELLISITAFLSGWDVYSCPIYTHIGHDQQGTMLAVYGKESFSVADGKQTTGIPESEETKLEIARFVLTGKSDLISIKADRNVDDYYTLAGIEDGQKLLKKTILGI